MVNDVGSNLQRAGAGLMACGCLVILAPILVVLVLVVLVVLTAAVSPP